LFFILLSNVKVLGGAPKNIFLIIKPIIMTEQNNLTTQGNQPVSLTKPILTGAGIGLIAISYFVFGADEPKPEWGKLWMIKPLIMVPLAGAMVTHFIISCSI
jgi:hypothetical protein